MVMNIQLALLLFAIAGNSLLGLFTFYKNPKSWTNRLFSLFTLFLNSYLIFNHLSLNQSSDEETLFWIRAVMSNAVILGLLFYFLAKTFPQKEFILPRWQLILSLVATTILFFLTQTDLIFQGYENETNNPIPGKAIGLFALYTLIFLSGGFIELALKLKNSTTIEKIQTKLFILGTIFMFVLILTTNFLFVVVFKATALVGLLPLYTLAFVGFISYAIIKHRFLDIRFIIVRSIAYTLLTLFIALGYVSVLFNFAFFIGRESPSISTLQQFIVPTILAVFFAISFQPLRRLFEKLTDRLFYKDHYDSNTLLWNLSRTMASTLDISKLSSSILGQLRDSIKINYAVIVLIRKKTIIWVGSSGNTKGRVFKGKDILDIIHKSHTSSRKLEQIIIYEELSEGRTKDVMREHGATIVLPLIVHSDLIGGLLLGEKSSGEIYSSEDVDLLKIVAPEVAVAVRNAMSYDEIKRFNITLEQEVKNATTRLQNANKRLKELDVLKDEFVSIASHELRTPMTAIKSYLWMALNKSPQKLGNPLKKYLNISYQSTERLIHLVNDMLTVSRIERNKIEIKKQPFDIIEILKLIFDELKITAEEKKIKLLLKYNPGEMYQLHGDKEKLREVFQNLVGNSLKFTPENGRIVIKVKKERATIAISVSDTGSGIREEDQSKLFKKFSKIEYAYANHSSQHGTGLGLYISKQIVSLHNGDITVQSEVDKGSTFTVRLPLIQDKGGESIKHV